MQPFQKSQQYNWKPGDVSTFSQQSQNLSSLGDQGLNTGQIDAQYQTAQAEQKAGQSAQNAAAGTDKAAQGYSVQPTITQATSGANPQVQPYKVDTSKPLPVKPNTNVNNDTGFTNTPYTDPTQQYLSNLFGNQLPDSITQALNQGNLQNNNNLSNDYNNLISNYQNQIQNLTPDQQYQNSLQNQLDTQEQQLAQQYQNKQGNLATQNTDKQKAISDYINNLQKNLKNYQTSTGDLGNVGGLSDVEKNAAAANAVLSGQNVSGTAALSALSNQALPQNSRLAALTQQAQSSAIQNAEGEAGAAQNAAKTGADMQAAGQKAQQDANTKAGQSISDNQNSMLNKLQDSNNAGQQALTDAYNQSKSNLSNQEQDYVNKAQQTLKGAQIPEPTIQTATQAFVNSVQGYLKNNNLSQDQKDSLKNQIESIWRIAVGTHSSDIDFSNNISDILMPLTLALSPVQNQQR